MKVKLLKKDQVRYCMCFSFPVAVTVEKQLYDAFTKENEKRVSYHSMMKEISKKGWDLGVVYSGPSFLPFHEVDASTKNEFKKSYLTKETKDSYIFTYDNWIRVDRIKEQGTDCIVWGTMSGSMVTTTEFCVDSQYDKNAIFRFDADGKFLEATFHGHTSSEVFIR